MSSFDNLRGPQASERPPEIVPYVLAIGILFLAVTVGLHACDAGRSLNDKVAERVVVAKSYDNSNIRAVAEAQTEAQRVAGRAWLACSHSIPAGPRGGPTARLPTATDLDRCEIISVDLAVSRGYSRADASSFLQRVRAAIDRGRLHGL